MKDKTIRQLIVEALTVPEGYSAYVWSHNDAADGENFHFGITRDSDDKITSLNIKSSSTIEECDEKIKWTIEYANEHDDWEDE